MTNSQISISSSINFQLKSKTKISEKSTEVTASNKDSEISPSLKIEISNEGKAKSLKKNQDSEPSLPESIQKIRRLIKSIKKQIEQTKEEIEKLKNTNLNAEAKEEHMKNLLERLNSQQMSLVSAYNELKKALKAQKMDNTLILASTIIND